jgi:hypothetical protein
VCVLYDVWLPQNTGRILLSTWYGTSPVFVSLSLCLPVLPPTVSDSSACPHVFDLPGGPGLSLGICFKVCNGHTLIRSQLDHHRSGVCIVPYCCISLHVVLPCSCFVVWLWFGGSVPLVPVLFPVPVPILFIILDPGKYGYVQYRDTRVPAWYLFPFPIFSHHLVALGLFSASFHSSLFLSPYRPSLSFASSFFHSFHCDPLLSTVDALNPFRSDDPRDDP